MKQLMWLKIVNFWGTDVYNWRLVVHA